MASGIIANSACKVEDAIQLTSFQGGWTANGHCFYQVVGNKVHLHANIRNGTSTDNTTIIAFPNLKPTATGIAAIFNISSKTVNGYATAEIDGAVKIHSITTNTNCLFDLFWVV